MTGRCSNLIPPPLPLPSVGPRVFAHAQRTCSWPKKQIEEKYIHILRETEREGREKQIESRVLERKSWGRKKIGRREAGPEMK